MIIVLMGAAAVSLFFGDVADAVIIFLVVVLNAMIGVIQEKKAEEAIDALKKMSAPETRVRRDGKVAQIASSELVPGDIILLEAGEVIPADVRLYDVASLKVEEAALTGESVPSEKTETVLEDTEAGVGDRINMAFMNTSVTYGRAEGIVVATGMQTEMGKITDMLHATKQESTPLQKNLETLGKYLTAAILIVAGLMFVIGISQGRGWLPMLLVSISLSVAAIPEGLPAIVTIILSIGTQRMAKKKAIVRNLPAVETLGSTDVICSDKTGTLTKNDMTVEKIWVNDRLYEAAEEMDQDHPLFKALIFPNDTSIEKNQKTLIGDPTETALTQYAMDKGLKITAMKKAEPRIYELPFDSERKMMTTIQSIAQNEFLVTSKGAPDALLEKCTKYISSGKIFPLTEQKKEEILQNNHNMAMQALRVLAGAYKRITVFSEKDDSNSMEEELVFAGMVGMIDPEREEAEKAIDAAKKAGISTIMITGDHEDTARAIAMRLGILEDGKEVASGAELEKMTDEQLEKRVENISVYARVSPAHKVRIVHAWQTKGKIVAMTGDGVNDAPALKNADIGIGMGITGTDVSKSAADIVLADDNFQTIVFAVEEGRKIFANIQKSIQFLLSANLGEVLTLFIATLLGWMILSPVHILWINLITDTFPAIALGVEPSEENIMQKPPRGKKFGLFSNGVLASVLYQGIMEGALTLFVYGYALRYPVHAGNAGLMHGDARTMAFMTLGLLQLFHAFNAKSIKQSLFQIGLFKNRAFNYAILLSLSLLLGVVFIPGVHVWFDVTTLNLQQWIIVSAASFSVIPIVETVKFFWRKMS